MDNWESLIASRMRPCESMPRHADPTKERKRMAHNRYYASEKGKEKRKGADARFRANHREERNEYNRNYYQAHKEYFAEYQKKYKARKAA